MPESGPRNAAGSGTGTRGDASGPAGAVVRRWPQEARVAVLLICDLAALFSAGAAAYLVWARPVRGQAPEVYLGLAPLLFLFVAGYSAAGLYPGFGLGPVETLRRLSLVTGFGFLVLTSISFALKLPHLYSRVTFLLGFVLALVAVPVVRAATLRVVDRYSWWPEPVVLVGVGEGLARMAEALSASSTIGYRPTGVLSPTRISAGGRAHDGPSERDPQVGRTLEEVDLQILPDAATAAAAGVRVVLVDAEGPRDRHLLDELQRYFRRVVLLRPVDELPVEGVQARNFGGALALEVTSQLLRRRNRLVKRAVDLALGGTALVLAVPAIAIAALAVKLASPGPAFFVQEREGLDGRRIRVRKIRTMHADAEQRLAAHLARRPELRREWEERYKLRDDPRLIPGLGSFLRRFSLDELPQLANVVDGSMSLVGPRPFPDYHLEQFSPEFRRLRRRVWPGITGLWQVTIRSGGTIDEQQAYDTYYIRNWSLWLDLYVLGRTLGAVVTGRGAY